MTANKVHVLHGIGTIHTFQGGPRRKSDLADTAPIANGAIIWDESGKILAVGDGNTVLKKAKSYDNCTFHNAGGRIVTPGLIDSHTHTVNAGSRAGEFVMRCEGAEYMDILKAGGGILNSADRTRQVSSGELMKVGRKALDLSLSFGVTNIEVKSGYGLEIEAELRMLRVIKSLDRTHNIKIHPTFLGAHAIPREFKDNPDDYVDLIINRMLPLVKEGRLADYCDVFIEEGVFSVGQGRKILEKAVELGLKLKVHADEIVPLGGTEMCIELGALSVDHLIAITDDGIEALAGSDTVGCLLPGTSFFLKKPYAGCRKMIDAGCLVSLATDNNPGSSRTENIQWILTVACLYYGLKPEEAFSMVTINAAKAMGLDSSIGSLEVGKRADIVVWDETDLREIPYHHGVNHAGEVVVGGKWSAG